MLQGAFFSIVDAWVVERRYVIFDLLPFYLYPTDLLLLPLSLVLAIYALDYRIRRVNAGRGKLLLFWWAICTYGAIIGILNDAPYWMGDLREWGLRSVAALTFYYIGLQADLDEVSGKIIRVGIVLACLSTVASVTLYMGLPFGVQGITIHGLMALLLPYSLLLARVLSGSGRSPGARLGLGLLALGILAPLSKSVVGAFLICNVVGTLTTHGAAGGRQQSRWMLVMQVGLLLGAIAFILFLAFFVGGTGDAERFIRVAYLKQEDTITDLSGGRLQIWRLGIQTWLENPVFGIGFGQQIVGDFLHYSTGYLYRDEALTPHNLLVQFLYQLGLVGFLPSLTLLLGWYRRVRHTMSQPAHVATKPVHHGFVIFLLTILLVSLYGQWVDNPTVGFLWWAAMGLEAALAVRHLKLNRTG
jgi:O-antigen ligase